MCCGGGGGGKCILFMRKNPSSHYEMHHTMHECVKLRKEFLSGAQNKRCVPRLRDELTALMFVSKRLRQQNMMSNTGTTKVPLIAHRNKVVILFPYFWGTKTGLTLEPKKNSWKMCLRLYTVIFTFLGGKIYPLIIHVINVTQIPFFQLLKFCKLLQLYFTASCTHNALRYGETKVDHSEKADRAYTCLCALYYGVNKNAPPMFLAAWVDAALWETALPLPCALAHRAGVRRWDRALFGHGAGNNTTASTEDIVFPE